MYDDMWAPYGWYVVSKNGNDLGSFPLNYSSASSGVISNHYFILDTISYYNDNKTLYIRNNVYDSFGNIYSRPRFDVMTNVQTTIKSNIYGYDDGIYTSEVFGWRSDGSLTNVSTITFINYICADIDNNGTSADIADLNYLVDYMFGVPPGPAPPHPASADVDCSSVIDIADLVYLVAYMFNNGPEPYCCHSLE